MAYKINEKDLEKFKDEQIAAKEISKKLHEYFAGIHKAKEMEILMENRRKKLALI